MIGKHYVGFIEAMHAQEQEEAEEELEPNDNVIRFDPQKLH